MTRYILRLALLPILCALLLIAGTAVAPTYAQPFNAQIQRVLDLFGMSSDGGTGLQLGDLTVTGTCTGCGGGGVTATGTPVDNQIAVWDSASSVEGDANLTWDGSTLAATGASVFGADLLTNGSFTGDASGWELNADCSVYSANTVVVTYDATCQGSSGSPYLSQIITTVAAQRYRVTFTLSAVSGDTVNSYGDSWSYSLASIYYAVNGTYTFDFTGTVTGADRIYFDAGNYNTDGTWTIDDVSVVPITTPAVFTVRGDSDALLVFDGNDNAALGRASIPAPTGYDNISIGAESAQDMTTGLSNIAVGRRALHDLTTGNGNVVVGAHGLPVLTGGTASNNVSIGPAALGVLTSGSSNVAVGSSAGASSTSGSNNIFLGNGAQATTPTTSNQAVLGNASITSTILRGAVTTGTGLTQDSLLTSSTAPTISSGFCTSAAVTAHNGTAAFRIDVGTTCAGISVGTIGLPAAATGWNCQVTNLTSRTANDGNETVQLSSTTTTAVIEHQNEGNGAALAWTDNDILSVMCFGF